MWRTLHLFLVLFPIAFATVVAAPKNVIVKLEWKPNLRVNGVRRF